jgi:hypothetical protein
MYIENVIQLLYDNIVIHTRYAIFLSQGVSKMVSTRNTGLGYISRQIMLLVLLFCSPNLKNKKVSNALVLFLCMYSTDLLGSKIKIFERLQLAFTFGWFPVIHFINITYTRYRKVALTMIYNWCILCYIGMSYFFDDTLVPFRTIFDK